MATILRIGIILDSYNQQYEFKVYENVYDSNLCNIIRRKYDFGNYILNVILIKKLQIGGHFAKNNKFRQVAYEGRAITSNFSSAPQLLYHWMIFIKHMGS